MPVEPLVDVARDAHVVPRRIALTAQYVHEPSADAQHAETLRMFRANRNPDELYEAIDFVALSTQIQGTESFGTLAENRDGYGPPSQLRCFGETSSAGRRARVRRSRRGLALTCLPSRSSPVGRAEDGSSGWTRTSNPPVNSRMLCH